MFAPVQTVGIAIKTDEHVKRLPGLQSVAIFNGQSNSNWIHWIDVDVSVTTDADVPHFYITLVS
jgi:hypothetical protein